MTSAQNNNLPVPFFANLIWQESRLHEKALSPKGAMGIAQFMPKVAAESGLENPFDPLQALPASAKLLHELFDRFGNLGYVAAAYNAGEQRVMDWLKRGRTLPRETRGYVMNITGRSVEAWRKTPEDEAGLRFAQRLPCREFPAFAALEQAQTQQAELEREQAEQANAQATPSQKVTPSQKAIPSSQASQPQEKTPPQQKTAAHKIPDKRLVEAEKAAAAHKRPDKRLVKAEKAAAAERREKRARLVKVIAKDEHPRKPIRREAVRAAKHERPRTNGEAKERIHHALREGRRRV